MALKIKWSKRAKNRYQDIIAYLNNNRTEKEVVKFIQRTDRHPQKKYKKSSNWKIEFITLSNR